VSGGHACVERLLLPEALSGRLEPAEEKRVMAHVEHCATCQDAAADIEVSMIALALLRDEREHPVLAGTGSAAAAFGVLDDPGRGTGPVRPITTDRSGSHWSLRVLAAAAAVILLAGGAVIGRQLLPPRDTEHYGSPIALTPPAAAPDQAARGSVAVAPDGAALVVRLNATGLKAAGWYECVWVAGGQSRSAGSFRAPGGVVKDVELRVAQPQDSQAWDLQVIAHQGQASEVVLEGQRT
jgi:hypothetical protein